MDAQETLCASLEDCAVYARGVEFGQLLARMQKGKPIADHFALQNREQILSAAKRLGWNVLEAKAEGDRVWIKMRKPAPQRARRPAAVTTAS